jgi:hypothetical protein
MTSSPIVFAPPFFLEALLGAVLFLAFAIVDGGLFSSPLLLIVSSLSLVSSVLNDDSVTVPAI